MQRFYQAMHPPMGGPFHEHGHFVLRHGEPPFWHWLIPLLFLVVLTGLAVWVVLRLTKSRGPLPAIAPAGWAVPPPARPDPAMEQARSRYARGEIGRDEFLRVAADLGGPVAAPLSPEGPPSGVEPPG